MHIFVRFGAQIFKMTPKINFSASLKTQPQINHQFRDSEIRTQIRKSSENPEWYNLCFVLRFLLN